jgi:hypothetical protein
MNDSIKSIDRYGNKIWKNEIDQYHRLDGPACIWADGTQYWYINGERHRLDGPACIWADGTQAWFVNGKYHRLDGPAIIWVDGTQYWYVNDNNITKEVEEWMKCNNISYPFDEETQTLFKLRFL